LQGSALDDAVQAPVEMDTAQEGEALTSMLEETHSESAAQNASQEDAKQSSAPPAREPGWIKQRVEKAVSRAVREAEARVGAHYEAILAPLRASIMDREAEELVRSGEIAKLELAKELVRLRHGTAEQAAQPESAERPRDTQGRFLPRQDAPAQEGPGTDAVARARSELLARQAQKLRSQRGVDVMQAFHRDTQIQRRVLSGEWDFYDVADHLAQGRAPLPGPVRSANGSGVSAVSVAGMTDEQFRRLQENLASGKRYNLRR
ncbi:MAG: hypothetical protein UFE80_01950, partial [Christensenellales bacterium]|nr:hypothetical protein [Christensenellales bacterium]